MEIPPFILQLLVENALRHAFPRKQKVCTVKVCAVRERDGVLMKVSDNGRGINPEMLGQLGQAPAPSKEGNGTALYNVNQRLTGLFGHQAALQIASELDKGTEISFKIPFQTEREGNRDAQGINRG